MFRKRRANAIYSQPPFFINTEQPTLIFWCALNALGIFAYFSRLRTGAPPHSKRKHGGGGFQREYLNNSHKCLAVIQRRALNRQCLVSVNSGRWILVHCVRMALSRRLLFRICDRFFSSIQCRVYISVKVKQTRYKGASLRQIHINVG